MQYIRRFSQISMADASLVGNKSASIGEMYGALSKLGIKVPNGFAITTAAYYRYLAHNQLEDLIRSLIDELNVDDIHSLFDIGGRIRASIIHGEMPDDLREEINTAYAKLESNYGPKPDVAVRSSATAEDLYNRSFAGQQDTYLNVAGTRNLNATCKLVFASLFTDRALAYREHHGYDHLSVSSAIAVQKMVRSDLAASGVIFTLDPDTYSDNVIHLTSAYGLGENLVQGHVNPDEFLVHKPTLAQGHRAIVKRQLGSKEIKMIYAPEQLAGIYTKNVSVLQREQHQFSLTDEEVLTLARYAAAIEQHYSALAGTPTPMNIEWAKDGQSDQLFIVQARPETVKRHHSPIQQERFRLLSHSDVLCEGKRVGNRIATGIARVIMDISQLDHMQDGEILVTDITAPHWEPVMGRAAALVTNRGGRTCHAAIIARERGVPAVVGCGDATERLKTGDPVTVSCAEGDVGQVYGGYLPYERKPIKMDDDASLQTHTYLTIANPDRALHLSQLPCDGVGLMRLEFILNRCVKLHPNAVAHYAQLSLEQQQQVAQLMVGYDDIESYYVGELTESIATIAAAFYPRPVMVRLSDLETQDYRSLLGGNLFETNELNPHLGLRGASRHLTAQYRAGFDYECRALRHVREDMGLDNIQLIIPFVRSVDEAKELHDLLREQGLGRETGLKHLLMCELPANALLAEAFLEYYDGMAIGSNDLTQLTLGVDRDCHYAPHLDERNPAVMRLIQMAMQTCLEKNKFVSVCGQAVSDFPEFISEIVKNGVHAISVQEDALQGVKDIVKEAEQAREQSTKFE